MSILSRNQVRQHTGSYQTIATNAPIGLLALRDLFEQEDSEAPDGRRLGMIFARDFRDLENGSERSKARDDVINIILSRRSRYAKYQTDLSQSWCLTNPDKSQTVLFEGIRFIMFAQDTEWVRIPVSGRIEVRPITRDGKATGEIVHRKMTMDLTAFWTRRNALPSYPGAVNPPPTAGPTPPLPPPARGPPPAELYGIPQQGSTPKIAEAYGDNPAGPQDNKRASFLSKFRPERQPPNQQQAGPQYPPAPQYLYQQYNSKPPVAQPPQNPPRYGAPPPAPPQAQFDSASFSVIPRPPEQPHHDTAEAAWPGYQAQVPFHPRNPNENNGRPPLPSPGRQRPEPSASYLPKQPEYQHHDH